MTVENCIRLLEAYKKQSENPVNFDTGMALNGTERANVISQSKKNYENMKQHILNSRKFKGHPIVDELLGNTEEKPKKSKKNKKGE